MILESGTFSLQPDDPTDLGGEIEFWLFHAITKSCVILFRRVSNTVR
jgi:hypothetical protein